MAQDKQNFLERWSRLKHESKELPQKKEEAKEETKEEAAAPVLPPLDKLTPESDFTGFMHPKVDDALRRLALKKLFSDPHFNVPDPFEPYSGDWTGGEPISEEMLATLNQARTLLFDKEEKKEEQEKTAAGEAASDTQLQKHSTQPEDDAGRKDS